MDVTPGIGEKYRRQRLLVPIAGMTLGAVVLLVLLTAFLISSFDRTALIREQHMVEQGFQRQLEQYNEILVPQANWDNAVTALDHRFDADFADANFGSQLFTFYGFTRSFIIDGQGQVIYASANGKRAGTAAYHPFAGVGERLLERIRRVEAARPPIRPAPSGEKTVTQPIQANALVRAGDTIYIVIASLIQPDLGKVLPKGPRAPVAITALPINRQLLDAFAARYLVDDLRLVGASTRTTGEAYFPLRDGDGREVGALAWTPRKPGIILYGEMKLPMMVALLLLGGAGWVLVRRSRVIVDEVMSSEEQARHLAYHDQLTGVPNRTLLFARMPALLADLGGELPLLAVLCVDLDRFKEVNDTMGHQAGDDLLKAVATRLRAAAAPASNALIARLGGDEFVLACPVRDRDSAQDLAFRCLDSVMQPVHCDFGQIDVGCSIGVVIIDDPRADPSLVLRRADMALYQAKADGRGRIALFKPDMDEAFRTRRAMEESLRVALRTDSFAMVYQPQVNLAGEVHSVEALLRWDHPQLGAITPAVFIPLAEETGLIMAIGEFVMRRVFQETGHWRHLRVAINVSAIQMRTPGFAAQVMQLAARAGIDPARYEIELTETALLGDGPATTENFDILRRMGFSIVLDDFGTGYSSLSLLHRYRFDKIKIDRSFVQDLDHSEEVKALVGAIVRLARSFRLGVIAEGVESTDQLDELTRSGCNEFQGFLTGRPMPAEAVEQLHEPESRGEQIIRRLA